MIQWRLVKVGRREKRVLQSLKLSVDYDEARKRIGAVLYQARAATYFSLPKLKPMFSLRPRSARSIRNDVAEWQAVMNAVGSD